MGTAANSGASLGPYLLHDILGEGAAGVVWRATKDGAPGEVALKLLRVEHLTPSRRRRVDREVRAVGRLCHPNVVPVKEHGRIDGVPYLAMELVDGPTLAARLRERRLSLQELSAVAVGVGRALEVAHRAGIVHRDVKPANVMLRKGMVRVEAIAMCDFGLAKLLDESGSPDPTTHEGAILGTPAYMAPEQGQGRVASTSADVYALGVVLFEAAAGRRPFEADSAVAYMIKHATAPVPSLAEWAAFLPEEGRRMIEACLKKEPGLRPGSAAEVARCFERWADALPPEGGPLGGGLRPRRRVVVSRRSATALSLAATLSLVVVALLGALQGPSVSKTTAAAELDGLALLWPSPNATRLGAGGARAEPAPSPLSPGSAPDGDPKRTIRLDGASVTEEKASSDSAPRAPAVSSRPPPTRAARRSRPTLPRRIPSAPVEQAAGASIAEPEAKPVAPATPSGAASVETVAAGSRLVPAASEPRQLGVAKLELRGGGSVARFESLLAARMDALGLCLSSEDGTVEVRLTIDFSGRADRIRVSGDGAREACLKSVLKTIRFPRPDVGMTELSFVLTRRVGV